MSERYTKPVQGFSNRETWAVALQLDNDRKAYRFRYSTYPARDIPMTADQAEAYAREWVRFSTADEGDAFDALTPSDLAFVNWPEIADHWNAP